MNGRIRHQENRSENLEALRRDEELLLRPTLGTILSQGSFCEGSRQRIA